MAEANEVRGEVSLSLEGVEYVLRPSYEAIMEVEDQTGKGILDLARDAQSGDLTLRQVSQVAAAFIRAGGRAKQDNAAAHVSAKRVGELIYEAENGAVYVMGILRAVLLAAATGGYNGQGEVKPATKAG